MINSTIITVVQPGLPRADRLDRRLLPRAHLSRLSYGLYLLFLLGIVLPFQLALSRSTRS